MAELQGEAPRVAHHDEKSAVGLGVFPEKRGTRKFKPSPFGAGIGGDDGEMEAERMERGVVRDRRLGIRIKLDDGATRFVSEEMGIGSGLKRAGDREVEMGGVPRGLRLG